MKRLPPKVGVTTLASPLEVGAQRAPIALDELAAFLQQQHVEVIRTPAPIDNACAATEAGRLFASNQVDAICLGAVTWFEDYLVLDMLEECDRPILLWPQPGMETGALCGTQQLTSYLAQLEKPYHSVFGSFDDAKAQSKALAFLRAAAVHRVLRRARIGLAGMRVYGMTEVAVNEMALKKVLGPRLVGLDMLRLQARASAIDRAAAASVWENVKGAAARVEVPEEAGLTAGSMYLALKETAREEGLSAIAFGCYPDLMGRACIAASLLADEGIPISCEGDVNGAVGMLMLQSLTGHPTHNTDWLEPLADGSVIFTHCGSGSYTLAEKSEDITLASVRLMSQGVCTLFPARPGPVTLVNLLPRGAGYQMVVLQGEAISTGMVFPGNPLRVVFTQPTNEIIDWIHQEGIGHHWMAGYGHVQPEIEHLAHICGPSLRYLFL